MEYLSFFIISDGKFCHKKFHKALATADAIAALSTHRPPLTKFLLEWRLPLILWPGLIGF